MNDVTVGIVGFGRIGSAHAEWLAAAHGIRAVAVCDPTAARRELASARGLRAHADIAPLLADPAVDAVLISTPSSMHFEQAARALTARKHVMVEKPMALDIARARELIHDARCHDRVLSVFHNRRWDPDYLTVKDAIGAGQVGRVLNVESRIAQWASCVGPAAREWHPNWRNEAAFGGGGLYDWGSHLLDQLWRLLWPAKPVRVFAQLRGNIWSQDCDDFARVSVDFDNGAVGLVEVNTTTRRPLPRWKIDGTGGSIEGMSSPHHDINEWTRLTYAPGDGAASQSLRRSRDGLSEVDIWQRFAMAVRDGSAPAVTAKSVLPTMCLLDAARASSTDGSVIYVHNAVDWEL